MIYKTYSDLSKLKTFEDRFNYLKMGGQVGVETFGIDRILNQMFYKSQEWKSIRDKIIIRDNGCDLGIQAEEISSNVSILIHHINPISVKDIEEHSDLLLNPENLISTTHRTHNAIHYGDNNYIISMKTNERTINDTCPWKI